jgi:hypothetical protein
VVYQVDKLKMAGKELLQQLDTPLLESLRQDGMVSIRESIVDDLPCSFLVEMLFIN